MHTVSACPAGAAQEEHLLLLRHATAAGLLLEHMYVLVYICIDLVAERAPTRRRTFCYVLRGCFYHPPWQLLRWRLGWKDCFYGWLLLDLLAISRMLCSIDALCVGCRLCLTLTGKKENRHGKK